MKTQLRKPARDRASYTDQYKQEAVTHVLSTAGEIIIASKRIRLSSFKDPAGSILSVLEATT